MTSHTAKFFKVQGGSLKKFYRKEKLADRFSGFKKAGKEKTDIVTEISWRRFQTRINLKYILHMVVDTYRQGSQNVRKIDLKPLFEITRIIMTEFYSQKIKARFMNKNTFIYKSGWFLVWIFFVIMKCINRDPRGGDSKSIVIFLYFCFSLCIFRWM